MWYQIDLFITDLWSRIPGIWNWNVFKIDKNTITLGQLIVGVTLLIAGYFLLRQLTRQLEKRILRKMEVRTR